MATILAISSQVAWGSVGLSVIAPALQMLGHRVIAMPTILLSNHPGHGTVAGQRMEAALLARMRDVMAGHGWLAKIDVVLSGYLPSVEHVGFVRDTVGMVRTARSACRYICDPVIGDDPKGLYIEQTAAEAIRDILLPLANVTTPNRFELGWLSGAPSATANEAVSAARALGVPQVVATSVPGLNGRIATMSIDGSSVAVCEVARRDEVPKGTGDFASALIAAGWPLGRVAAALDTVIAANEGRDELDLGASGRSWITAVALKSDCIDATG